jgi:uncharacterized Zn finger protein (UPF0148 family)
VNYNCERCGDRLGWREHVGPTLCELCRLRAEVERLNTRLVSAETYRDAARDEAEQLRRVQNAMRRELHTAYEERKEAEAEAERLEKHFLWEQDSTIPVCPNEAEVERLRANQERLREAIDAEHAEVERLRAQVKTFEDDLLSAKDIFEEVERLRAAHECCWHDGHGHGAIGPCAVTEREARAALAKEEA